MFSQLYSTLEIKDKLVRIHNDSKWVKITLFYHHYRYIYIFYFFLLFFVFNRCNYCFLLIFFSCIVDCMFEFDAFIDACSFIGIRQSYNFPTSNKVNCRTRKCINILNYDLSSTKINKLFYIRHTHWVIETSLKKKVPFKISIPDKKYSVS